MMRSTLFASLVFCVCAVGYCALPDSAGYWQFNGDPNSTDPNLVLAAEVGNDLVLVGEHDYVDGIGDDDRYAVSIGVGSHFQCIHGIAPNGGGTRVNEWTLLIDFSFPQSSVGGFIDFFQTDPLNETDSDWTVHATDQAIGIGAVGYSRATGFTASPSTWYRMVMTVDNGTAHNMYIDGDLVLEGNAQAIDDRFSLADVLLLFAANDGDDNEIFVSTVALWDQPLTPGEIIALGGAGEPVTSENTAPEVDGGVDIVTEMSSEGIAVASLSATVIDDGDVSVEWSLVSGPADVTFNVDSTVTLTEPGKYVLMVTADDGEFAASDTVNVLVRIYGYDGMLVEWLFEEQWDANSVLDTSGNMNDGIIVDGPVGSAGYTEGVIGNGLDLQNGDFATGGDFISLDMVMGDSGTIAMWYYVPSLYNYQSIFDNSVQQDDWEMWIYEDSRLRWRVQGDSYTTQNLNDISPEGSAVDQWFHIATTWNRTGPSTVDVGLYVNGVLRSTDSGAWVDPGSTFYLGGGHNNNDYGDGVWDEFRIYERVLSESEVRSLVWPDNEPPNVDAGTGRTVELPSEGGVTVDLNGTVFDENLLSVEWSKVSGPNDITFADPSAAETSADITSPGIYILQLAAEDGEYITSDTVVISVLRNGYGGLLVDWKFEETWNGSTVLDSSGNNKHGNVENGPIGNATYTEGKVGNALDLQNGDYTTGGDHIALDMVMPDSGTIAMWYYVPSLYNYQSIFDNSVQQDDWEMWIYGDSRLRFRIEGDNPVTANLNNLSSDGSAIDEWFHITVTWQKTGETTADTAMYINGILTDENSGTWVVPGDQFYLGGGSPGNDYGTGIWDEFLIYDRVLAVDEIRSLVWKDNQPPLVEAGPDETLWLSGDGTLSFNLKGSVDDDGGPGLIIGWSMISGPNEIDFADQTQPDTEVTIFEPGTYHLVIDANDGQFGVSDDVIFNVYPFGYTGLMAHWTFDDDSVADISGEGNDGVYVDGTNGTVAYVPGKLGKALDFQNSHVNTDGDYISLDYTMADSGAIAMWYKVSPLYNYQSIFDNSVEANDWEMWIYNDSRLRFRIQGDNPVTANLNSLAGDGNAAGKWFHIVTMWRKTDAGADTALFVNGVFIEINSGSWVVPGTTFYLGGGHSGNMYSDGIFDDVRIYERLLSAQEIASLASLSDFDQDIDVDVDDLATLAGQWLTDVEGCESTPLGDYNMDCRVNLEDFAEFAQYFLPGVD